MKKLNIQQMLNRNGTVNHAMVKAVVGRFLRTIYLHDKETICNFWKDVAELYKGADVKVVSTPKQSRTSKEKEAGIEQPKSEVSAPAPKI